LNNRDQEKALNYFEEAEILTVDNNDSVLQARVCI